MTDNKILIGGVEYPKSGWAVLLSGGASSGKSTLIRSGVMKFEGEILSADTMGEDVIEIHNNAALYAQTDPERLKEVERLIAKGCKSRHGCWMGKKGVLAPQNVHIDLNSTTYRDGKMSTILSNGAFSEKEAFFKAHIHRAAEDGMRNLILDMTGKPNELDLYTEYLKALGYKIALVWVITERRLAILRNLGRPRAMKISAVQSSHDNINTSMMPYLQDGRASKVDATWLYFTEEAEAVALEKVCDKYIIPDNLQTRIVNTLGYNSPKARPFGDTPQWQMDESGKRPIVIDEAFVEKYTVEVVLPDGSKARALVQLRTAYKADEGGLIVYDSKTHEPKLQKCNAEDTPTYPYVLISEADYGKQLQRRNDIKRGYRLRFAKVDGYFSPLSPRRFGDCHPPCRLI